MKKYLGYAAASVLMAATACTDGKQAVAAIETVDLYANIKSDDTNNSDEVFEIVSILQPELTDSTLLSFPKIAGTDGDKIYMYQQNTLLSFDMSDNKCLSSFSRKGQGPGEYDEIWSARFRTENREWTVYDYNADKIYIYTENGEFKSLIENDSISHLYSCGDGWAALNRSARDEYIGFDFFTSDWKAKGVLNTGKKYQTMDNGRSTLVPVVLSDGNTPCLLYGDTLYAISAEHMNPMLAINTGELKKPDFATSEEEDAQRDNYIWYRTVVNGKSALVYSMYDKNAYFQVYSRADGQLLYSQSFDMKSGNMSDAGFILSINGNSVPAIPLDYTDNDNFYMLVNGEAMSVINGDDESNPAILKVKIKN